MRWIINGIIVKVRAGQYTVLTDDNKFHILKARGVLRIKGDEPCVGDKVEFSSGAITSVYPRKSYFSRPKVANVDCINIVIGITPPPDMLLVDKLIASAHAGGADAYLTVNKSDLDLGLADYILKEYKNAVEKIFVVSAVSGEGLKALKADLKGKICALCGQSATGKTSLVNAIFGTIERVGELSQKTNRGRHTTTASSIHFFGDTGIVDTPGFSSVSVEVDSTKLKDYYNEFQPYSFMCKFKGCVHMVEPDCAVKLALEESKISTDRYNRYQELYKELKENEKFKY